MKADIELVKTCLQRQDVDIRTINAVIEEITTELQSSQEDKPPREKYQIVLLASDPESILPDNVTGWALKIPEEDAPWTIQERIHRAAYEFNVTPKGRRMPVRTVGEAIEVVPGRILKEQRVRVLTKEPVLILKTQNRIPSES